MFLRLYALGLETSSHRLIQIPFVFPLLPLSIETKKVGNNLQGSIPDELRLLTNLLVLDFSVNGIKGSIPSIISELSNLGAFVVNSAQISGTLPENLGLATALRRFDVSSIYSALNEWINVSHI